MQHERVAGRLATISSRWARVRAGHLGYPDSIGPGDYLPRWMFGQYLEDVLGESKASAAADVWLEIVVGEAVNIEETHCGPTVVLLDGRRIEARGVVLALGILPGEYPIRRPLPFYRGYPDICIRRCCQRPMGGDRKG